MQGKVKWFNQEKGFGFIIGEDEKEYFVHYSQICQEGFKILEEGNVVDFEPVSVDKGLQAHTVHRK